MNSPRDNIGDGLLLAYGSIAFFTSLLHNIFLLYHVQAFIAVYHIDKTMFWIGELAFLVWNSVNDPLFGWFSDSKLLWNHRVNGIRDTLLRRVTILRWAGTSLAGAFILFWFPWGIGVGLQFLICLLLYDSCLTLVDLHHSALLAEFTLDSDERANLSTASAAGSALGASSVFLAYLTWNGGDLAAFQRLCTFLAVLSLVGFVVATLWLHSKICRLKWTKYDDVKEEDQYSDRDATPRRSQTSAMLHFSRQLMRQKNFMWFSLMHLLQVFHCHFNSNFFPLFLHTLLAKSVSSTVASSLMSVSFVLPHINNFYFLNACKRYGAYHVIKFLFAIKIMMSVAMIVIGYNFVILLCIFIASNRIFTEGTCKLLTLIISDLVDEDTVLNHRSQPLSALIYGSAALVAKPGQTIAPLLGTFLLSYSTGHDIFQNRGEVDFTVGEVTESFRTTCFHMLTFISAGCGIIQLLTWTQFKLRDSNLRWVKNLRSNGMGYLSVMYPII